MSETDSFIDEVTEEVRRDQLYGYAKRYGWIAVVVILGAVGYTAWTEYSKSRAQSDAQAAGNALLSAFEESDPSTRAAALSDLGFEGDAASLTLLAAAATKLQAGDRAGALADYDTVAATAGNPLYRDMAQLRAVIVAGSDRAVADRRAALEGLAVAGAVFRPLAREQLASLALEEGDRDTALELFTALYTDSQSTDGLRRRAQQMIVALGGELPAASELLLQP